MLRSLSFLPGNTPNMLINGDVLGADAVILDLEDAVSPVEKDSARILVRNILRDLRNENQQYVVRINSTDTEFWKDDLRTILPVKPNYILPPKIDSAEMIKEMDEYIIELENEFNLEKGSVKLIPLIETALGVENAFQIASSSKRIAGIALGAEDLTADLRCKRTKGGEEIFYARTRLVCAARAARVDVFDTPFTDVDDMEGLIVDIQKSKDLGFTGKLVISPRHIDDVNELFSPTLEEIEYAKEVLEVIRVAKEQGKGVVSFKGKMIDAPIVERAKQVCLAAEEIFGGVL